MKNDKNIINNSISNESKVNNSFNKFIGMNIKKKRIEAGLTQEELAKRLGYKSKSTINKIEMGINDINQEKMLKFSNALCCPISELMGWSSPQKEIDYMIKSKDDFEVPIEIKKEIKKLNKKQIVLLIAFLKMLNEQN